MNTDERRVAANKKANSNWHMAISKTKTFNTEETEEAEPANEREERELKREEKMKKEMGAQPPSAALKWWAVQELNLRPHACRACALAI